MVVGEEVKLLFPLLVVIVLVAVAVVVEVETSAAAVKEAAEVALHATGSMKAAVCNTICLSEKISTGLLDLLHAMPDPHNKR